MVDVTVLGDINLDILSPPVDTIPKNEQIFLNSLKLKPGGGAANFAVALAKLGMKTKLIGSLGDDGIGDYVMDKLKVDNLELDIKRLPVETGISFSLQFSDGSKKLFTFRGNNSIFSLKNFELKEVEGSFLQVFGYNLMDNLRESMPNILQYAKDNNLVVGMDPDLKFGLNFNKKNFKKVLKFVDVLFLNESEYDLLDLKQSDVRTLVIKRGANGAMAIENGKKIEIEGVKVEVKNPTGVGDIFDAAFVHHYFYGYNLKECLEFAREKAVEYLEGKE